MKAEIRINSIQVIVKKYIVMYREFIFKPAVEFEPG